MVHQYLAGAVQDEQLKASVSGAAFRESGSTAKIATKTLRKNNLVARA